MRDFESEKYMLISLCLMLFKHVKLYLKQEISSMDSYAFDFFCTFQMSSVSRQNWLGQKCSFWSKYENN